MLVLLLPPASIIQATVQETQNVHELGRDHASGKLQSLLKNDLCLRDDAIAKICDCIKSTENILTPKELTSGNVEI